MFSTYKLLEDNLGIKIHKMYNCNDVNYIRTFKIQLQWAHTRISNTTAFYLYLLFNFCGEIKCAYLLSHILTKKEPIPVNQLKYIRSVNTVTVTNQWLHQM